MVPFHATRTPHSWACTFLSMKGENDSKPDSPGLVKDTTGSFSSMVPSIAHRGFNEDSGEFVSTGPTAGDSISLSSAFAEKESTLILENVDGQKTKDDIKSHEPDTAIVIAPGR